MELKIRFLFRYAAQDQPKIKKEKDKDSIWEEVIEDTILGVAKTTDHPQLENEPKKVEKKDNATKKKELSGKSSKSKIQKDIGKNIEGSKDSQDRGK